MPRSERWVAPDQDLVPSRLAETSNEQVATEALYFRQGHGYDKKIAGASYRHIDDPHRFRPVAS